MRVFAFVILFIVAVPPSPAAAFTDEIWDTSMKYDKKTLETHYIRAQLLSNATKVAEMLAAHHHHHHHPHLIPTDEETWMSLLPRKAGPGASHAVSEYDWAMLYRTMKRHGLEGAKVEGWNGGHFLKEISLHDVRVDPDSIHGHGQQTNLEYLLEIDVDRLVWSFRRQAGLKTPGTPYEGWEKDDSEIRGHFVGHYMSATAMMWASTHNDTLKKKMDAVVSALHECQQKMGTGYLSAFPTELIDRYEALQYVWVPYYTIHKIMAGLLDQYKFAGNSQALKMLIWMVEYFGNRVVNVIKQYTIARHWAAMDDETGGMNDVLYNLYAITGDQKHLMLAHLFDKPSFLGPLALQDDALSGLHANTHIPILVGAQRRYEITGDPLYEEIGKVFMSIVNSSHAFATGGTSTNEHWTDPNHLATTLSSNNEETCTTYNMLKVSRNLFRWTKEVAYADYYERALTNGILSVQRGREPGIMIYFLPMLPGGSKSISSMGGWGTKFETFWCCYGTGIESFSKLGDSIYFEEEDDIPKLYIIQFISSSLNWKSGKIILHQKVKQVTSLDQYFQVSYKISSNKTIGQNSTLNIRVSFWTSSNEAKVILNGQKLDVPIQGGFLSFTKEWGPKDEIDIQFPIGLRTEAIQDNRAENASTKAILFGSYVLAGLTCNEWELKPKNANLISEWIIPVPQNYNSQLVSLTQESMNGTLFLSNINSTILDLNRTITMEQLPKLGTSIANQATFRLIYLKNTTTIPSLSRTDIVGESIMLEPFDLPGKVVRHHGPNNSLTTSVGLVHYDKSSVFRVVVGLDGNSDSISLESENIPGCFLHSQVHGQVGGNVRLVCQSEGSNDAAFRQAASFTLTKGLSEYHTMSFIAKGTNRNFLLQPLMSLKDEHYTVYFNIGV